MVLRPFALKIFVLSIVALFSVDLVLLSHNDRLQTVLRTRASSMLPQEGTIVPELHGLTTDARLGNIGYDGERRQTVLFVFSPDCPFTDMNWPYWEAIARQIDTDRFRLVYANISDFLLADSYTRTHYFHPDASVFAAVDAQSTVDYNLSQTPILMIINSDGTVQNVWVGYTRGTEPQEMESVLGITLSNVTLASSSDVSD